jgi:hypothetical protein
MRDAERKNEKRNQFFHPLRIDNPSFNKGLRNEQPGRPGQNETNFTRSKTTTLPD